MLNEISRNNLKSKKKLLNNAMNLLTEYSQTNRHTELSTNEQSIFRYIMKCCIFWEQLYDLTADNYYNQMISDLICIPKYIINSERRALELSIRSILENYIRIIQKNSLFNDHITLNVLNEFKKDFVDSKKIISQDEYSKIRSLYASSSENIHGNIASSTEKINIILQETLIPNQISENYEKELLQNLTVVLKSLIRCFANERFQEIYSAFYREFTILEFLTSKGTRRFVCDKVLN